MSTLCALSARLGAGAHLQRLECYEVEDSAALLRISKGCCGSGSAVLCEVAELCVVSIAANSVARAMCIEHCLACDGGRAKVLCCDTPRLAEEAFMVDRTPDLSCSAGNSRHGVPWSS